ncbi:3-deoxy-D-manno-octulosonic acid transferase [Alteromonas sp. 5E99-2]|uniref:3-deoxy-D-manno-octulosonic acid transferase n=1 Tax=Alteromonas sp. 5E99-2 TaxID=2817683 RepID=UPI001A97F5FA|nr:3-deoxy-D-manno-octulosonic acid transferase [Alteromonas sp. 5E99-2]MBO1254701.1 3-deoxy-D-manno-octulosonic acid transferase [Alteromonas sp. 5E99-2]
MFFVAPIYVLVVSLKKKNAEGSYSGPWWERYGAVKKVNKPQTVLFHCVSVGEVNVASRVIYDLLAANPNEHIVITTTTTTGSARVRALLGDSVTHFYLPFDLPFSMALMLKRVSPRLIVITEVELWPNLIDQGWKKNIPIVLLNARMTDRSANSYSKISLLFTPMLRKITHICAQGTRDYQNYLSLGALSDQLTMTNNVKFDLAQFNDEEKLAETKNDVKDFISIIGASTHEGEEAALLKCVLKLKEKNHNIQLVLVPRHPERFDTVSKWLTANNIEHSRSSKNEERSHSNFVTLVDEMGKLNEKYSDADIAFVGGSLADRGGHNALEAAVHSLPIIMGSHLYNNPDISLALEQAGALTVIEHPDDMYAVVEPLVLDKMLRKRRGQAGKAVITENAGAVGKTLKVLQDYLINT